MAETKPTRVEDTTSTGANNQNINNQTGKTSNDSSANRDNKTAGGALNIDPKEIYEQAKDTAGQVYNKATEQASSQIDTQKENLARGLSSVADGIRKMGDNLRGEQEQTPIAKLTAKYGDSLAQQVEQVSNYIENKDLRDLVKDIEVFARRNPAIFIGGAFALGIAAARFLKSNNPSQSLTRRPNSRRKGVYIPDESEGVYLPEDLSRKVGLSDSTTAKTNSTNQNQSSSATAGSTTDAKTNNSPSSSDKTSSTDFTNKQGG